MSRGSPCSVCSASHSHSVPVCTLAERSLESVVGRGSSISVCLVWNVCEEGRPYRPGLGVDLGDDSDRLLHHTLHVMFSRALRYLF